MSEVAERYSTSSPYCALGLQLCRCLGRDSVSNINRDQCKIGFKREICSRKCNSSRTHSGLAPEPVNERRKLLEKMKLHDRPSLSKQWANTQKSTCFVPTVDKYRSRMKRGQTPLDQKRALRPIMKDHHHQDSLFGNSFQSKSFFVVHPEWLSETVDNTDPEPLHRPPWPWEQPRYRQNIQTPITYTAAESDADKDKTNEEKDRLTNGEIPTALDVPFGLPIGYTFTHPGIDLTKPFEKQTQFGAPLVDTSVYKLSY